MSNKKNLISDWLREYGDEEIQRFINKNVDIAQKVNQALEDKGWSKSYVATQILEKQPSEVSKWLSGTHNLNLKSIVKMEKALGIELVYTKPFTEYQYVYLGSIQAESMSREEENDYEATFDSDYHSIAM